MYQSCSIVSYSMHSKMKCNHLFYYFRTVHIGELYTVNASIDSCPSPWFHDFDFLQILYVLLSHRKNIRELEFCVCVLKRGCVGACVPVCLHSSVWRGSGVVSVSMIMPACKKVLFTLDHQFIQTKYSSDNHPFSPQNLHFHYSYSYSYSVSIKYFLYYCIIMY